MITVRSQEFCKVGKVFFFNAKELTHTKIVTDFQPNHLSTAFCFSYVIVVNQKEGFYD